MPIIRYQPAAMLNQIQEEMNRVLNRSFLGGDETDSSHVATSQWAPAVDIIEESNRFILLADIPGVEPKSIEISMEDGALTIKGERIVDTKEEKKLYKRIERTIGTFYRRFSLPDSADGDNITAQGRNGVLEIIIPKIEKSKTRRIEVKE